MSAETIAESTPAASTVNQAAPAHVKKAGGGIAALAIDLLVILVVSCVVAIMVVKFGPAIGIKDAGSKTESQFIVADIEGLARDQMVALGDMVNKGEIEPSMLPSKTEAFSSGLINALQSIADESGKVVLRRDSVLAAPGNTEDRTEDIRSMLVKSGVMKSRAELATR